MTDEHDDDLRDALRAEADGVEARPELLDRINADASTPAPSARHTRRARILAVAAAFVLAGGTVAVLARDDGDDQQRVDVSDDGSSSSVTAPSATACGSTDLILHPRSAAQPDIDAVRQLLPDELIRGTEYFDPGAAEVWFQQTTGVTTADDMTPFPAGVLIVDLADEPANEAEIDALIAALSASPAVQAMEQAEAEHGTCLVQPQTPEPPGEPTLLALVREDGMLMTVDLATGEQRELFSLGDPNAEVEEVGSTYFIDDVELSPDGRWIYYTACCEPAVGLVHRVPIDATGPPQGEAANSWFGLQPRVSADSKYVATSIDADGSDVVLSTADGTELDRQPIGMGNALVVGELVWSADGNYLAAIVGDPSALSGGLLSVVAFEVYDDALHRRTDLDETFTETPPGREPASVHWTGDQVEVVWGGPDQALRTDASGDWWLWRDADGTLLRGSIVDGAPEPIPGLPKVIAADW